MLWIPKSNGVYNNIISDRSSAENRGREQELQTANFKMLLLLNGD